MSKPPEVSLPSVYQHLDFRQYLQQWLEAKQAITPGYTLSRFARKAGCSYSHVRNVFQNERKLLSPLLDGFIAALRLDVEEAEFFTLLVRYQQSPSLLERAQVLQLIAGSQRIREARPEQMDGFVALAKLSCSAVYELAFAPDFQADPIWISNQLGLSAQEAESALHDLIRLGLLVGPPGQPLQPAFPVLRTAPEVQWQAARILQTKGIEAAGSALEGEPDQRYFYAAAGAIPATAVPNLRATVGSLHKRLNAILAEARTDISTQSAATTSVPGSVYQLQMQAFPVVKQSLPDTSS